MNHVQTIVKRRQRRGSLAFLTGNSNVRLPSGTIRVGPPKVVRLIAEVDQVQTAVERRQCWRGLAFLTRDLLVG
jgi:hypothetical protein